MDSYTFPQEVILHSCNPQLLVAGYNVSSSPLVDHQNILSVLSVYPEDHQYFSQPPNQALQQNGGRQQDHR